MLCPHDFIRLLLVVVLLGVLMTLVQKRVTAKAELPPEAPYTHPKTPENSRSPEPIKEVSTAATLNEKTCEMEPRVATVLVEDVDATAVKQYYDAFLVVDVEATCLPGTDFNYANEIIASCFSCAFPSAFSCNSIVVL
jgi:hypothetical protein